MSLSDVIREADAVVDHLAWKVEPQFAGAGRKAPDMLVTLTLEVDANG